ncbi:MAG: ABC transporter permease [Acidimicrobiales bacterium]
MNLSFVGRKVLGALLTLVFVLVFNFFLFRVVEDNPVDSLYRGRNLSPSQIESLEERFGVNDPITVQFGKYVVQTAQFDLGVSIKSSRPVSAEIADALWPTVWLVGTASVASALVGTWIGIRAGWRRNSRFDRVSTALSMFTYSVPDFWLGMLLLSLLAVKLDLFPTGGFQDPGSQATGLAAFGDQATHMVLPALTLMLAYVGEYAIVMRASVLDTVREDYLQVARAKGLRDILVRRRHAVPNALLPVVSLAALNFGFVLSGAIAVESVFSWPGLGQETFNAVRGPDFPMLQGLFLLFSLSVIVANLIADLLYGFLDPRVRTQ